MASKKGSGPGRRLFCNPSGQSDMFDESVEEELDSKENRRVECLGMTFDSEEERRGYFLNKLRVKLEDSEFRKTPGFPKGSNEAILKLSDPPWFTACPNPFLREIVAHHRTSNPGREEHTATPHSSDISEGKGTSLYKAHTYHTKVPPQAIATYILHYTKPGDVVLDAFAGSGMTGVAATLCASPEPAFKKRIGGDASWGRRLSVLVDLSPFATFLSSNMTEPVTRRDFEAEATELIHTVESNFDTSPYGDPAFDYLLWSQVLICPSCSEDFDFFRVAIDDEGSISSNFSCPSCGKSLRKSQCDRKLSSAYDEYLGHAVSQNEYVPLLSPPYSPRGSRNPQNRL